jgi:hypothetical protein
MDTGRLLLKQVNAGDYRITEPMLRVIVNYLAVEELAGGNNKGVNLFDNLRIGLKSKFPDEERETIEELRELSRRVSKNGFSPDDFVTIDRNQEIVSGHGLVANAVFFGMGEVPVRIAPAPSRRRAGKRGGLTIPGGGGKGGMVERFFGGDDIELIEDTKDRIFFDLGLYFPGILWGPVYEYFDVIIEKMSKKHRVVFVKDYRFDDSGDFYEMLKKLYSWEAVKEDYIRMKFDYLVKHPLVIRSFSLRVSDPEFRLDGSRGVAFSSVVKDMKEDYRRIYSGKVENYIRDVVLHLGDNFQHNRHIMGVLDGIEKKNRRAGHTSSILSGSMNRL